MALSVQALVKDALDGAVLRAAEGERAFAGCFQPRVADLLAQPDEALCAAQVDEHRVVEQREDHAVARWPDFLCARQAPLRIVFKPCLSFRRLVVPYRVAATRALPRMGRDELVLVVQLDDRVSGLQPEGFADQCIRRRVQRVTVDDVSVAVDADFLPDGDHRRHVRQRREQRALDAEARERLLVGRAVRARAGLLHDPLAKLPIGVGQVPELAQRHEGLLDVFDARLDDAFLLGIAWRAGVDLEAVRFGECCVGTLYGWIVPASADDRVLRVVDDDPGGTATKPFEGAPVTGQPRFDGLVQHDLGVLVTRPAQRHNEDPRPNLNALYADPRMTPYCRPVTRASRGRNLGQVR